VNLMDWKKRFGECLRRVRNHRPLVKGETPHLVYPSDSADQPLAARLQAMADAGLIKWSGKRLEPTGPVGRVRGEGTVSDLIVADRR